MKRFFMAALAVALLASSAMAANVASVTEQFATTGTNVPAVIIYNNRSTTNHEAPSSTYSPGGFKYGGWCAGPTTGDNTANLVVQFGGQGTPGYTPAIPALAAKPSSAVAGTYFYTIFDSAGSSNPTSTVVNAASVTLVTPKANAATEVNDANFAILLRDASGAWFQQVDGLQKVSMTNGVENTYTIPLAGRNFQALATGTGTASEDMNQMDAGTGTTDFSPGAIVLSGTNVAAPTSVTGFGLIQMSALSGGPGGTNTVPVKFRGYTVSDVVPPAAASVSVGSTPIADGETVPVDLGSYEVAETATDVVFTVQNTGGAPLTVSAVTAPTGVTIVDNLTAGDIAPMATDTFTVKMNTAAELTVAGEITFTAGANTFNFAVSGNVGPVTAVEEWTQYEK